MKRRQELAILACLSGGLACAGYFGAMMGPRSTLGSLGPMGAMSLVGATMRYWVDGGLKRQVSYAAVLILALMMGFLPETYDYNEWADSVRKAAE